MSDPQPLRLLTYLELMSLPQSNHIVKNLIGENQVGVVYGSSTAGKSFLILDLLFHIANAQDWFGYRINQARPVVYFALEGKGGISRRMSALENKHGIRKMANLHFMVQTIDLTNPGHVYAWASVIRERGLVTPVVAIDTVAQSSVGIDENSSEGMGLVIAGAQEFARLIKGTIVLVHHSGKDSTRGARGWSGLKGAMDFQIEVTLSESGTRQWKVEKTKEYESGKVYPFGLEVVTLYTDKDGDEVTSCRITQPEHAQVHKATFDQIDDQVWRFIGSKIDEGQYPTKYSIRDEMGRVDIARASLDGSVARLKASSRLEDRAVPKKQGSKGGKQSYLYPLGRESVFNHDNQTSDKEALVG